MNLASMTDVCTTGEGVASRRTFLGAMAGAAGAGLASYPSRLALQAAELKKKHKACILLFMGGGPSQFETFDPKPGTPTGGPTKAIPTAVPGIDIAADWTHTAKVMKELAVIRSMTDKEGEHERARYHLHTGYPMSPSVRHPTLGSIVASEIAPADFELPHFVKIGSRSTGPSASYLGMKYAPFDVGDATKLPRNVALPTGVTPERFAGRLELSRRLYEEFAEAGGRKLVEDHRQLYERAGRLVTSSELTAFDLAKEPDAIRDRYGRNPFGQGCLLARRLIERGITFVEVASGHPQAPAAWDTHIDNFDVTRLLVNWVDPAYAALISELKDRGLLDSTLVIWMGEFGRTPKINDRGKTGGRDHFPKAFNVALAGCGIKGGQVIGATTPDGSAVKDRPVTVPDLFASFCKALDIDATKEHLAPGDLPVKLVKDGKPVGELFG
jgi:hypothetical protein